MSANHAKRCPDGHGFDWTTYPYLLDALSICDKKLPALFAHELLARPTCRLRCLRLFFCGASFKAATSRHSQADTEISVVRNAVIGRDVPIVTQASDRLAIAANKLAAPCASMVGAVRSAALAIAAHPAGDIVPAAASTLH
uniref:Uncharacterized protein n=1 Tax=Mantoniella antarctica TaxID=81844 RepID=A0A7S0SSY9_9CHLO|mmetsp:Transcript_35513/g.88763  ORF Transcript_35513/g.88763 Transcript_35513/m.88763 type:complete len:141 (+) Transcript_35513:84-506(+)